MQIDPQYDAANIHALGNLSPEDQERFNRDYETACAWVRKLADLEIGQTRDTCEQAVRDAISDAIEMHVCFTEEPAVTWKCPWSNVIRHRGYLMNIWDEKTGYLFNWFAPALITETIRLSDGSVREQNLGLRVIFIK